LVLLEQIGGGRIFVKVAGFVLLNPDPDQVSADVVAFGEPMNRFAGQKLLSDLALELDAVRGAALLALLWQANNKSTIFTMKSVYFELQSTLPPMGKQMV